MTDITPLDQEVALLPAELDILERADEILDRAVASGNPDMVFDRIYALRRSQQIAGLSAAKMLHGMKERWDIFATDDTFEDYAMARTGYSIQTIRKYCDAWEYVIANPSLTEEQRKRLMGKTWGSILLIAPSAKADELEESQWNELVNAPDKVTVRDIIRGTVGEKTSSKTALKLFLYTRGENKGQLMASKNDVLTPFGHLDLDSTDPAVVAAITRIMKSSGVLEL